MLPTPKLEMVRVAVPPLIVPVPIVVVPFLKVTVPVGVPAPVVTPMVAVSSVALPNIDGFTEDVKEVLVEALATTCETVLDVEVIKLPSPL